VSLVSVVIPAYNRDGCLEIAVRSVLAQSYQHFEIVIVDDGSTDNTAEIARRLVDESPRVRLLRHTIRKGAQAARNTGILAGRGQWIAFLDSDDRYLPDSVGIRLRAAASRGVDVVHSECDVLRAGSAPEPFGIPAIEGWVYNELLRSPGPMFQGLLVSKTALERIGFLDETIVSYQEWDLAIRLAKHHAFAFVPESTFIYDCRSSDTISSNLSCAATGYAQVIYKHRWSVLRHLGPKALASHYDVAATFYSAAGREEDAIRCRKQSIAWWPFRPASLARRIQRLLRFEPEQRL
jgi:glycosyltransferase involved in cell wall biosynthesis